MPVTPGPVPAGKPPWPAGTDTTPPAWTHAGYLLVFLRQPGGLLGVLTSLVALMISWSLFFGSPSPVRGAHTLADGFGDTA